MAADRDEADEVGEVGDELVVDVLWRQLMAAKEADDAARVRSIENRMRELGEQRRFAHLSDDQLDERIESLAGERAPRDMLGHSPGGGGGGDNAGSEDILRLNHAIRANQHVGVEATLNALLDERERRRG